MSELVTEISTEVEEFLDRTTEHVSRYLSRTAIVHVDGSEIEVSQMKRVTPEEASSEPEALATTAWFEDVDWLENLEEVFEDSWYVNPRSLSLEALYPITYFDEAPVTGSFKGDRWQDDYGSISGFGSKDEIKLWTPDFVAAGSHVVTRQRYPDNPKALDVYNARYREYMGILNETDPTMHYHRGWDRKTREANLVLKGLSLSGLGLTEIVKPGTFVDEYQTKMIRVGLHYEPEKDGYIGNNLLLIDGQKASTEPYWDGEEVPASDELLATALRLVREATAV